jgi:hypothetical protein
MSSEKLPIVIETEIFKNIDVTTEVVVGHEWREDVFEPVGVINITLGGGITQQAWEEEEDEELNLVNPRENEMERLFKLLKQSGYNNGR